MNTKHFSHHCFIFFLILFIFSFFWLLSFIFLSFFFSVCNKYYILETWIFWYKYYCVSYNLDYISVYDFSPLFWTFLNLIFYQGKLQKHPITKQESTDSAPPSAKSLYWKKKKSLVQNTVTFLGECFELSSGEMHVK